MAKIAYVTLIGFLLGSVFVMRPLMAQEQVQLYSFSLDRGEDKPLTLEDFKDQAAIVIVFTSSHCSWATQYIDRLNALHEKYAEQKVAFLAINSNDPTMSQRDTEARMRKIADYPFPYLKDKDQSVAKMFEVTKNPEAIVLVPKDKGYEIVYRGKIDDNPLDAGMVKKPYLAQGIDHALAGTKPAEIATKANGCSIKWIE